jgi:hypothetical protein
MVKDIPDWAIERAAELWTRALKRPIFSNGDFSSTGNLAQVLAESNAIGAYPSDMKDRLATFKSRLIQQLKFNRDHDGELTGNIPYKGKPGEMPERFCFSFCLSTDYAPDSSLSDAAKFAGIPFSLFSWKSRVYIGKAYVSSSWGYGAESDYHYPLSDGRWLICKLCGSDIDKVIASLPLIQGLIIEDPTDNLV